MMIFNNTAAKTTYQRIVKEDAAVRAPKVLIKTEALVKMRNYVDICDKEIAWLCVVEKAEDGTYIIEDTILFKQDVSASTADICEVALNEFASELALSGQMDLFNKIRGWGHSHVNMAVFASGTDESTFKSFYSTCDYFIRLICNKKGELKLDIVDCDNEIRFDNVEWEELMSQEQATLAELIERFNNKFDAENKVIRESITKEIADKVSVYKPPVVLSQWQIEQNKRKEEEELKKTMDELEYLQELADDDAANMAYLFFDELEILQLSKSCKSCVDLKIKCMKEKSFLDFNMTDWADLFDSVQDAAVYLQRFK